ncbi:MAG: hypothetical protein GXO48_02285 [Chlorobi bacterium]|nr:hypothetical protein [Chlorobiota bacterium]
MRLNALILAILSSFGLFAKDSLFIKYGFLQVGYGIGIPAGNIKQISGLFGTPSVAIGLMTNKAFALVKWEYFFSQKLPYNPLEDYVSIDGFIYDDEGIPAVVQIERRGWSIGTSLTLRFPIQPESNMLLTTGISGGYFTHWLRIHVREGTVSWLTDERIRKALRGRVQGPYGGLNVGLWHDDPERMLTFALNVEFKAIYSTSMYDIVLTPTPYQPTGWDFITTVRLAWFLPVGGKKKTFEY